MNDGTDARCLRRAGPRHVAAAAALAGIALLAAGCGGGSHAGPGSSPGQSRVQQLALFARCMRGHGVTNFYFANPDSSPNSSSGPVLGIMGEIVPGVNPQTTQFATAMKACRQLLPGGPPSPITQRQKDRMLKFAACIRAHGYPSYPDPQFRAGGGVWQQQPSGIDSNSPRFQAAVKACNRGS